jgi:hypothetical protein
MVQWMGALEVLGAHNLLEIFVSNRGADSADQRALAGGRGIKVNQWMMHGQEAQ